MKNKVKKSYRNIYIYILGPKGMGNVESNALPNRKKPSRVNCYFCGTKRTRRHCSSCMRPACIDHVKDVCHKCFFNQ